MVNNKNNIPDGFHNAVLDAFQEIDSMSNNAKQINKNRVLKVVAVAAVSGILLSISAFAYTEIPFLKLFSTEASSCIYPSSQISSSK